MKSVIRNLRTKSFLERRDFMVYERLGIKKVWDGKKEYCSEKNPEKKEGKSGRYTEILQIFHMTVMILGNLYGKNLPCTGYGRKTGRDLCSVCSSWQRKLDMQKQSALYRE